jgi:hypothetical protein
MNYEEQKNQFFLKQYGFNQLDSTFITLDAFDFKMLDTIVIEHKKRMKKLEQQKNYENEAFTRTMNHARNIIKNKHSIKLQQNKESKEKKRNAIDSSKEILKSKKKTQLVPETHEEKENKKKNDAETEISGILTETQQEEEQSQEKNIAETETPSISTEIHQEEENLNHDFETQIISNEI